MPLTEEERWRRDVQRDWRRWCDQLVALATTARDLGGDIVAAAALERAAVDGFPSSSIGGGLGGGADALSYSDPTGNRVASPHPIVGVSMQMRESLAAALKALEAVDRAVTRGRLILRPPVPPGRAEAPECINCARFEIYTPATRAGRCEDCAAYRDTYRRDATEKVVRARPGNATPRQLARKAAIPGESARWMNERIEGLS